MKLDPKNLRFWFPTYILSQLRFLLFPREQRFPCHVIFCFVDHFEPYWGRVDAEVAKKRVEVWKKCYPRLAERHRDSNGKHPKHTFFYPIEEYDPGLLDYLAELCEHGFGEVEVHYHHDQDTSENLRKTLWDFKKLLREKHCLLSQNKSTGEIMYGFIHGNWALDNSRSDGKWCGVNDEITILKETGCYADFTLPSAPSDTQTQKINSIYYATDDPMRPKSHDSGTDVAVGQDQKGDLMIVQGPLCLNFKRLNRYFMPRIESGEICWDNPPCPLRWNLWLSQHISVLGREDWIFIKVFTHGAQEKNFDVLLGEKMEKFFQYLEKNFNDGSNYLLHYVSARELYNIIKAAEAGCSGDPDNYRDFILVK